MFTASCSMELTFSFSSFAARICCNKGLEFSEAELPPVCPTTRPFTKLMEYLKRTCDRGENTEEIHNTLPRKLSKTNNKLPRKISKAKRELSRKLAIARAMQHLS
jgi:hypothetical protein